MIETEPARRCVLWKRHDQPGHEACRFARSDDSWQIVGTAVFVDPHGPAQLSYRVVCEENWTTRSAEVEGWIGSNDFVLSIVHDRQGHWTVNGGSRPDLNGLMDVDLGFTPSTNTLVLRRLSLEIGDETDTTAAWLDTDDWTIKPLLQNYRCKAPDLYAYASPGHDYHAELSVDDFGVVTNYPDLWSIERI